MDKVIPLGKLSKLIRNFKKQNQSIVLAGGCFDVLHPGHIIFLQKAKKAGDILIVLLESDERIKMLKGILRPVHNQKERALILSALQAVDFIILLPSLNDKKYDEILLKIKPDTIALTRGIDDKYHKKAAGLVKAKLKFVTKMVGGYSTTRILTNR